MINASLERLCDIIQPDSDPRIKVIKDISAGAVLVVSMASLFIGLIIFLPKLLP
jgi:diacylglycerol kinase (ATP)